MIFAAGTWQSSKTISAVLFPWTPIFLSILPTEYPGKVLLDNKGCDTPGPFFLVGHSHNRGYISNIPVGNIMFQPIEQVYVPFFHRFGLDIGRIGPGIRLG